MPSRPERPKAGPKGRYLEVGPRRGHSTFSYCIKRRGDFSQWVKNQNTSLIFNLGISINSQHPFSHWGGYFWPNSTFRRSALWPRWSPPCCSSSSPSPSPSLSSWLSSISATAGFQKSTKIQQKYKTNCQLHTLGGNSLLFPNKPTPLPKVAIIISITLYISPHESWVMADGFINNLKCQNFKLPCGWLMFSNMGVLFQNQILSNIKNW